MNLKHQQWDQWFAGLVDGSGCFYINKKKEISFEITTAINNVRILYNIKNHLKTGSIKLRSGSNSIRYRVKTYSHIYDILNQLNGQLRNPVRLNQFTQACFILNIPVITTTLLVDKQNSYLSGLIDAEGTINISVSKTNQVNSQKPEKEGKITRLSQSRNFHHLSLKITTVSESNLIFIQKSYQLGNIYCEKRNSRNKTQKIQYHWTIVDYEEFILLYEYLKIHPLKSVKMHRIRLILCYFKYKELKYHLKSSQTVEYKIWLKFCKSWFKYNT